MSADGSLRVVLCWHMHQPQYQDLLDGSFQLPWTYLHAIKDYVDMAAHLEAHTGAHAVVNFAPTLLEQIDDYARQVRGYLDHSGVIRDPLLAALASPVFVGGAERQLEIVHACLRANRRHLVDPFPQFRRLADIGHWLLAHPESLLYVDEQFLTDLVTWYHLVWLGETVRRTDPRVRELMDKAKGFTAHDRRILLELIADLLEGLNDRYRRLAESGRVELSVTPYAHPILPLLIDFRCASDTVPDARLPASGGYPGGTDRARWHIEHGIETFRRRFGFAPQGCWPAEGGVSVDALALLDDAGFRWAATGEGVLANSLGDGYARYMGAAERRLSHPYRVGERELACFFRDDELSDRVGFVYAGWHGDDAVSDLVHRLETIADTLGDDAAGSVISIILDGENAWEHYPANGYHFVGNLYARLSDHPRLQLTTFSQCLDQGVTVHRLPRLVAGSWVYGNLATWIGDADKNRGWDMLVEAKERFDRAVRDGRLEGEALETATRQLAICEGSDWFWWFGDDNPAEAVAHFERLYRRHLTNLYQLIGEEPPDYLSRAFTRGSGSPEHGGVMRPGQQSGEYA